MIANVQRGDVLVSSSDESEIEHCEDLRNHDVVLHAVTTTRLSQLVSELSESPPLNDFSRIFQLTSLLDHLVRQRLRIAWTKMCPDTIVQLRKLFGFQLLTSVVRSTEKRFLAISMMLLNRRQRLVRTGGSIKAS